MMSKQEILAELHNVKKMVNALYMQRTSYDIEEGTEKQVLIAGEESLDRLMTEFKK